MIWFLTVLTLSTSFEKTCKSHRLSSLTVERYGCLTTLNEMFSFVSWINQYVYTGSEVNILSIMYREVSILTDAREIFRYYSTAERRFQNAYGR